MIVSGLRGNLELEESAARQDVVRRIVSRSSSSFRRDRPCSVFIAPCVNPSTGRMTPEELDRNIEFIIESQARLAAAQEKDRHDRIETAKWAKRHFDRIDRLIEIQSQLLVHHSERMDRLDRFYKDWLKQIGDSQERALRFQQQALDFQKQALHLLNMILDRLPSGSRGAR
jgi:hypothetical protein